MTVSLRPKAPAAPPAAAAVAAPPSVAVSPVAAAIVRGRRFVDVEIPRTDPPITGKLRVLSHAEETEVTMAVALWLRSCGVSVAEIATRGGVTGAVIRETLARAIRDPADVTRPLASLEEWREADDGQLRELWDRYADLVDAIDPDRNRAPSPDGAPTTTAAIVAAPEEE